MGLLVLSNGATLPIVGSIYFRLDVDCFDFWAYNPLLKSAVNRNILIKMPIEIFLIIAIAFLLYD